MIRLTLGAKVHMLLSFNRVPLPASFLGSVTRTSEVFSPLVHERIDIVRSQSGRWIVIDISEYDEVPRQWSMAFWIRSRGFISADITDLLRSKAVTAMIKRFIIVLIHVTDTGVYRCSGNHSTLCESRPDPWPLSFCMRIRFVRACTGCRMVSANVLILPIKLYSNNNRIVLLFFSMYMTFSLLQASQCPR